MNPITYNGLFTDFNFKNAIAIREPTQKCENVSKVLVDGRATM